MESARTFTTPDRCATQRTHLCCSHITGSAKGGNVEPTGAGRTPSGSTSMRAAIVCEESIHLAYALTHSWCPAGHRALCGTILRRFGQYPPGQSLDRVDLLPDGTVHWISSANCDEAARGDETETHLLRVLNGGLVTVSEVVRSSCAGEQDRCVDSLTRTELERASTWVLFTVRLVELHVPRYIGSVTKKTKRAISEILSDSIEMVRK
jgi:hypothetical protein